MKKAVLLGAGASRGALGSLRVPVASEFGQSLAEVCPGWKKEYPALLRAVEHLGLDPDSWPLEPVWSCIDWYAKLQPALPRPKPWEDESPQIKKALLAVYGARCDDAADHVRDDSTIAQLFQSELQTGDVLISFNYDTIAERVAVRCGRQLRSALQGGDGVLFAKPHGSTSWTLDHRSHEVTWFSPDGSPLLRSLSAADIDCSREPLLLGAVPIKSELIREVQAYCGVVSVFDAISAQWRTVVEAIRDAEALVVVGYSFPVEDRYGRFLVQEGLRLRARDLRIEFFEVEDRAADRAREIFDVFPGRVHELVYRGRVKPSAA
jgi:hypothetical protein